jgi:hypothetical protein
MGSSFGKHKPTVVESDMDKSKEGFILQITTEKYHEFGRTSRMCKAVKEAMDENYGLGHQCIMGDYFGSSVTHIEGSYIAMELEGMMIIVFKTF